MTVAFLLAFTVMASAAPNVMQGCPDSEGLLYIDIYNPETVVSTTTQSDYVLSGVAKSGNSQKTTVENTVSPAVLGN